MTLFNSGDKIEDLLPKYMEVIPSFNLIILQIGNNNSRDNEVTILTKMQQLYEGICNINPKAQVFTGLLNYQLSFACKVIEIIELINVLLLKLFTNIASPNFPIIAQIKTLISAKLH